MQFGTPINNILNQNSLVTEALQDNYPKYSLYPYSNEDIRSIFLGKSNLRLISNEISDKLTGVKENKRIVVPDQEILKMMANVSLNNYYDIKLMNEMVVNIFVNKIRNEFEVTNQNNKLSIWTTQYTSDTGMRRHSEIKLKNKHPTRMVFNMNY